MNISDIGTPYTEEGARQYDHLHPVWSIALSWDNPGKNPMWHRMMQNIVRKHMPVLAHNLDRLVELIDNEPNKAQFGMNLMLTDDDARKRSYVKSVRLIDGPIPKDAVVIHKGCE